MHQLTKTFNDCDIRIVNQENGEIWFVAKDICDALEIKNNRDVLERLDEDEKLTSVLPTAGQNRHYTIVSESGLYKIIFQSNKPNAKQFTNWVTKEVLPSIRKNGSYGKQKEQPLVLSSIAAAHVINIDNWEARSAAWLALLEQAALQGKYNPLNS